MKGLLVDFSFALFLLVDLAQPFSGMRPNAVLRGMMDSRGAVQQRRQQQVSRLPLYMMQLYRTMLTEDRERTPAATEGHAGVEDNPALHDSDSVISLVAKSEYSPSKLWLFFSGVWCYGVKLQFIPACSLHVYYTLS